MKSLNKLFAIAALFIVFVLVADSSAQVRLIYNALLRGTTTISGPMTFGATTSDIMTLNGPITSNQSYSTAQTVFYFRSSLTATSGEHNNIRGRAQNQATGASTSDIRGVYGQATTTASLFGGAGTGVFANFIAKNLSTTVTGRALFAEAETEATPTAITNMYTAYFRTKAHKSPTGEYYMLFMEDELVATGFPMDAYIGMESTSWGGGNSATYGIDMNGIDSFTTGDVRLHNGALFHNSSAALLTITEATVDIDGASTASSYTADSGISSTAGATTFNESGADADFRVETASEDSALVVDGADGDVYMEGLGTGTGTQLSRVSGTDEIVEESSSRRYKDNIQNWDIDVSLLNKLQPRQFDWNTEEMNGLHDYGMVAEEVAAIIPEAALLNGEGQITAWSSHKMIAFLVEVIKNQENRINKLEKQDK